MIINEYPAAHTKFQQAKQYSFKHLSTTDGEGIIDHEAFDLSQKAYVATVNEQITGFLLIAEEGLLEKLAANNLFEPQPLDGLLIQQLFVDPQFRQQGIAQSLLASVEQLGEDLYLYVSDKNSSAKKFYAKRGFKAIGLYETSQHNDFSDFKAYLLMKPTKKL